MGQVLLGSLGSLLVQVGQMAIAVGVGLEAIQKSLLTLNPAVAIVAGVALVSIGSMFSSMSKNLGGGMGSSSASSGGGGGSYAPQTTRSYSSSSVAGMGSDQEVVFRIAGTDLIGVIKNTLDRNSNLGGSTTLAF